MGEGSAALKKLSQWLVKYKYAWLVLLLGVVLLLWPSGQTSETTDSETVQTVVSTGQSELEQMEQQLAQLLSQVEGAGQVQVMLTLKTGTQYIYQTDQVQELQETEGEKKSSTTVSTVIVSQGSSQEEAVVTQTIYPTFQGAVVISTGGDQARVKLNLVNAVSSLTGLSADKITVIKMTEH